MAASVARLPTSLAPPRSFFFCHCRQAARRGPPAAQRHHGQVQGVARPPRRAHVGGISGRPRRLPQRHGARRPQPAAGGSGCFNYRHLILLPSPPPPLPSASCCLSPLAASRRRSSSLSSSFFFFSFYSFAHHLFRRCSAESRESIAPNRHPSSSFSLLFPSVAFPSPRHHPTGRGVGRPRVQQRHATPPAPRRPLRGGLARLVALGGAPPDPQGEPQPQRPLLLLLRSPLGVRGVGIHLARERAAGARPAPVLLATSAP